MKKYKEYFNYESLYIFLNNSEILNQIKENEIINCDNLNISFLSKIAEQVPELYISKIENIDKERLKDEIKKEDKKNGIINALKLHQKIAIIWIHSMNLK